MFSPFKSAQHLFSAVELGGFLAGMMASLPIAAGYLPVAISFGLVAVGAGLKLMTAVAVSALLFAGASQFVLVSMMVSGAGFIVSLATVLLMNVRHIFYGPALLRKFTHRPLRMWPICLSFGLTDEVFAASLARLEQIPEQRRETWFLGLQFGAYVAWLGGTALGAVSGSQFTRLPSVLQHAVHFVLPALFMALLIELASREVLHVVTVAALTTVVALLLLPAAQAIPLGMLIGALSAVWWRRCARE